MDYFQMICGKNPQKVALVVDGVPYCYGELASRAAALGEQWEQKKRFREVRVIKEKDILSQLTSFLACHATGEIPLLVPYDNRNFENGEHLVNTVVPENACMAVATSGTTGVPKIYFRSYESWAGYFDIQNDIFQVAEDSCLFVQGSIAFTGNLNLYMAQFYAGGTIVAENTFQPKRWETRIRAEGVNMIYLIPAKLMLLPGLVHQENRNIRMILSGSQSLGREDAEQLKKIFPNTHIILYYGASELNYITYVTDENMTDDKNLIGKPFPQVEVSVQNNEIFVHTAYHVEGIRCPYSLCDRGRIDDEGNIYFLGRKDDLLNVRGRKVSALRIENILKALPEVQEAAVILEHNETGRQEQLVAYIVPRQTGAARLSEKICQKLRKSLEHYEMPRRIYPVEKLPKNESGKVDKKRLNVLQ